MARVLLAGLAALLAACAGGPPPAPESLGPLARRSVETGLGPLTAYVGAPVKGRETAWIFLEGDGAAWPRPGQPPADPTPRESVMMPIAATTGLRPRAYLARPCQFRDPPPAACTVRLWTVDRFSPAVVQALDRGVSALRRALGARRVVLVGHSGGATLALLLARRRDDVAAMVGVAGILDHRAWTRHHGVTPLHGSLQPDLAALRGLPQIHLAGSEDDVAPAGLMRRALDRAGSAARLRVVRAADHNDGWTAAWSRLEPRLRRLAAGRGN